jgi:exopolysaccharide biosynthesis polyprenyl glycosylphosphotransferase
MGIAVVFLALPAREKEFMVDLVADCEGMDIDVLMVPDVLDVLTSRVSLQELEGLPLLTLKSNPLRSWGRVAKRAMDVLVAGGLLFLLWPLLLIIALAVRLDSRGPALFRQQRAGLDGRPFTMLKFRSMQEGADAADGAAGLGVRNDPRRTRLGALLRKTSLDELPQLLNVLRGDMSLVGPRPERVGYVEEFGGSIPRYLDRHRVNTGITGWAQVNGLRGDTSLEERIRYDLYYIENWSLAFDMKILLMTVRAALRMRDVH